MDDISYKVHPKFIQILYDLSFESSLKFSKKMDRVTFDILDNSKCTASNDSNKPARMFRPRSENENIVGIILHFTMAQSVEWTYKAYYGKGVSAHYLIDMDGKIICNVNPETDVAFHAGVSQFRNFSLLNQNFIGIEHINPGYLYEDGRSYDFSYFGKPVQLPGDEHLWFSFTDEQFESSALLTRDLQRKFKIRGSLVITHADIAIGRKYDIGPMYDYERAFKEYGAGYYPKSHDITLEDFHSLKDDDYLELLHIYGYKGPNPQLELKAFQYHFSTSDLSGTLSDITKERILNLIIDYYEYNDPYQGLDIDFRSQLTKFIHENLPRTKCFFDYITLKNEL